MSKFSRAAWRGLDTAQQNAYEQAEDRGDEKAMTRIYRDIEKHHEDRTIGDVLGGIVDKAKGSLTCPLG